LSDELKSAERAIDMTRSAFVVRLAVFLAAIKLGAAAKDQLGSGLEKFITRSNLDEATKLLAEETA
jgi:hypothetical protein